MRDKNINDIKSLGFTDINFSGYGGSGFEKEDLEIWIGEWGIASISKIIDDKEVKCIRLGDTTTELLKEEIIKQIDILNFIF